MIDTEKLIPMVKANAQAVRNAYPVVQSGDVEGVQWEWVYSNVSKVEAYISSESLGLLSHRLRSVATRWAAREREHILGRDTSDLYVYTQSVIRELLRDVFHYEDWQPSPQGGDGMPTGKGVVSWGGDRMAMLADVSQALKSVTQDQWDLLVWHFKYNESYEQISAILGVSPNAIRMRISRAVDRVRETLMGMAPTTPEGADPEYTGSRKVMTNAASRALLSSYTD